jgi:hypothetical protein
MRKRAGDVTVGEIVLHGTELVSPYVCRVWYTERWFLPTMLPMVLHSGWQWIGWKVEVTQ